MLRTRLAVLTATAGAAGALLADGVPPVQAAAVAAAATVGGVEVGCRLTLPHVAPKTVVSVLVVVLALVVSVVRLGYPVPECLAVVLAAAWCTAELARRVTGLVLRPTAPSA
ncbi:hypothetical protein ACFFX1_10440 [Dactylosporangium sucinum]|uniref:hypothetical protein n=1 Tax=Dactylosporangium sucinum TaxID=1424081 RepID=UPI00167E8DC0|nr:hypothetical protein [Dactylosporangium sucinum]